MASQEDMEKWRHEGFDAVLTASDGESPRGIFRGTHELYFDEPEYVDIGEDEHPCPHDYLLATVGGCQLETLKQCLEKGRVDEYDIEIQVESKKGKVEVADDMPGTADIRITDIHTDITVEVPPGHEPRASRCLDIFEAHCPISQSVDAGVTLHTSDTLAVEDS
ncbi:hypothetical protein GS429_00235 [Natronorubrum sp. JWXQ-INN-674]|uniref:OsmC family peroxiredoxin n=1 Tax=Natronorubrum halalkaliphilum TaxID=2691917 RepID=A0A6B0VGA6_9EURY|nr:OsmC family protein [Natronorubrum halalkaliphilum]MXV60520.1 hypothetical protein [Natronorubrum halalkaliphilum]